MKKRSRVKPTKTEKATIADAVRQAWGELEGLAEELREVVDNASGTPAENTQRIQTLSDTVDTLEGLSEPDVPEKLAALMVEYVQTRPRSKRKGLSRADRCGNACLIFAAVIEVLDRQVEEKMKREEGSDDEDSLRELLESLNDEAEGLEFPGMYG